MSKRNFQTIRLNIPARRKLKKIAYLSCLFTGGNVKLNIFQKIQKTKKAILSLHGFNPTTAVIAGSGLGEISKQFTIRKQ